MKIILSIICIVVLFLVILVLFGNQKEVMKKEIVPQVYEEAPAEWSCDGENCKG
jgi:hypothetical protein